ncbi:hypothetical protein Niako_2809 [Niastella koreensis GR20-10]|uniref:Uncharacterized protein n=1 Tax=Niastella koreensis (strain DSM 17620 / KACC 11465 / NBRC 106392 / GR20-10) TaxID=700598 RepID=G8T9F3_NIAKG|nr:hypothetical protein Niako_2809 [Niastella koreensis GR20-10]
MLLKVNLLILYQRYQPEGRDPSALQLQTTKATPNTKTFL